MTPDMDFEKREMTLNVTTYIIKFLLFRNEETTTIPD